MDKAKDATINGIYSRVLKEIKPSDLETRTIIANSNEIMNRLAKITGKSVELRVAGSIARGTNLKGNADIDIFMLFHKKTGRDELVKKGLSFGKKLASGKRDRYEIKYAEHAYVRVYLDKVGMRVDLVPALKIDNIEEMGTTVDRTPLHTEFINTRLSNRQRDDVRLLKYLLKAHNIYGAEVKIGGFPGYLCELLIYQFGSLTKLLESAAQFRLPLILDPISRTSQKDPILTKKFNSNFIVIDPVDRNRNVGAGVSLESLSRFVMVARDFVERPEIGTFYGKGFSSRQTHKAIDEYMRLTGLEFFLLVTKAPDKSEDVVWPQLRKLANMISEHIERSGFSVYLSVPWVSGKEGFILTVTPKASIPTRMLKGPSAFIGGGATNFLKNHADGFGILMRNDTLYALERNSYPDVKSIMNEVAKGRLLEKRKDISLKSAKLFHNTIPSKYSETAYVELCKKIKI
jgi:tRNA nucleotidyltransferase (CCA-adding enzyme)